MAGFGIGMSTKISTEQKNKGFCSADLFLCCFWTALNNKLN